MSNKEAGSSSSSTRDRSVNELEKDAEQRRERIGQTLDQLEGRIAPDRMMDNAVGLFKEHGGEIADGLQRSVKNNPLPLILTGVGIAWMMMNQRDGQNQSSYRRSSYDQGGYPQFSQPDYDTRYVAGTASLNDDVDTDESPSRLANATGTARDAKDGLADSVSSGWSSVKGSASNTRQAAGDRMGSMQRSAGQMSDQMQQRFSSASDRAGRAADEWSSEASRFMQEQPLVAGALGIAFGALLGGLLPTTAREKDLARQAVNSDAGQRAMKGANQAFSEAKQEADQRMEAAAQETEKKIKESKEKAERA